MTIAELEKRLTTVERELAELKSRVKIPTDSPNHWVEEIAGTFSDPESRAIFDEAMRLGREWRNSQRPKPRKAKRSRK
jgi:hypothetical protein